MLFLLIYRKQTLFLFRVSPREYSYLMCVSLYIIKHLSLDSYMIFSYIQNRNILSYPGYVYILLYILYFLYIDILFFFFGFAPDWFPIQKYNTYFLHIYMVFSLQCILYIYNKRYFLLYSLPDFPYMFCPSISCIQ